MRPAHVSVDARRRVVRLRRSTRDSARVNREARSESPQAGAGGPWDGNSGSVDFLREMGGCCSAPREVSGDGFSQADQAKRVDLCARSLALNDGRLIVYGEFPTHRARPAAPT